MKFFSLVSLVCAGGLLFAFLYQDKGGTPGHPASSGLSTVLAFLERGVSAASGTSSHRKSWQRSELCIARGTVMDQSTAGVLMDCSGWIVRSIHGYVYAGDGPGMDTFGANLVDAHEQFQFGRLMTVDHGVVRQSTSVFSRNTWNTGSYLNGRVLLKNYPPGSPGRGRGFKVVVAPDGEATWQGSSVPAYTATFTLAD